MFIQSAPSEADAKTKYFSPNQKKIQKEVGRVFGVLFKKYMLLFVFGEYRFIHKMNLIATVFVLIRKMIVNVRRSQYQSDGTAGRSNFSLWMMPVTKKIIKNSVGQMFSQNTTVSISDDIKIKSMPRNLDTALIEHQWMKFGGEKHGEL